MGGRSLARARRTAARDARADRRRRPDRRARTRAACSAGSTSRIGLVHRPQVLFLDEPTTGLDPEVRAAMWEEISRLADRAGAHDPAHHALPRGGRPPRAAARDRRSRPRRRRGHARALKRELRGDALQSSSPRRRVRRHASRVRSSRVLGVREVSVDGRAVRARADDGARAVPAVLQALEARGRRRGVRDGRPAVARRRLPALHGPHVRRCRARSPPPSRSRLPPADPISPMANTGADDHDPAQAYLVHDRCPPRSANCSASPGTSRSRSSADRLSRCCSARCSSASSRSRASARPRT